jgi:hypothetical protein
MDLEGACTDIRSVAKIARAVRHECEDCVKTGGE